MLVWLPFHDEAEARAAIGELPAGIEAAYVSRDNGLPDWGHDRVEYFAVRNFEIDVLRQVIALPGVEQLRWIQLASAGYDYIIGDIPAQMGLCNAVGVHHTGTAELGLALALAHLNGLQSYADDRRQKHFAPHYGRTLADRRVLILGYGQIGQAVERRLAGFEVAAVRRLASWARWQSVDWLPRYPDNDGIRYTPADQRAEVYLHDPSALASLLPRTDVVFITAPATGQTYHLLGADQLALLPDGALIVNIGRGSVLDSAALLGEQGRIEAALDVTDPEPLPEDHPLWTAPYVTWTPHVGGWSGAFQRRYDRLIAHQLRRLAEGLEPDHVVRYPS